VHRGDPGTDNDRPDKPAEQGMRGTRRQPEEPGHQIPNNRTDQPSQDDRSRDQLVVKKTTGDRLRDLSGQTSTYQIEQGTKNHSGPRSDSASRDRPGHRVGAVMEAVGVVKDQGHGDNRYDNEELCHRQSPSGTGGLVSVSTWQRRSNLTAEH
jgi:hypothetical protein